MPSAFNTFYNLFLGRLRNIFLIPFCSYGMGCYWAFWWGYGGNMPRYMIAFSKLEVPKLYSLVAQQGGEGNMHWLTTCASWATHMCSPTHCTCKLSCVHGYQAMVCAAQFKIGHSPVVGRSPGVGDSFSKALSTAMSENLRGLKDAAVPKCDPESVCGKLVSNIPKTDENERMKLNDATGKYF